MIYKGSNKKQSFFRQLPPKFRWPTPSTNSTPLSSRFVPHEPLIPTSLNSSASARDALSVLLFSSSTEVFERHSTSLYISLTGHRHLIPSPSPPNRSPQIWCTSPLYRFHNGICQSSFYIQEQSDQSPTCFLGRGIRQGCPLSP